MLQEERSEQSESEVRKIKQKGKRKQIYLSLRELRRKLEESGEDSETEEELTEGEEEGTVKLVEKHSLRTPEIQHPKMALAKQGRASPYCSSTLLLTRGNTSSWLQ